MSKLRKIVEVGRFLQKDHREVLRLIEVDGLPVVKLPGEKKPTLRFRLKDVHTWLCQYVKGATPMSLEDFLKEFDAAQGRADHGC